MSHCMRCVPRGAALLGVALAAAGAQAALYTSEFSGAQQIWLTADDFTARSGGAAPHYFADPNANDPLSGSAYYFGTDLGSESPGNVQDDWWVQYEIPVASVPGNFSLTGSWSVHFRTQIPTDNEVGGGDHFQDSDWLLVNGDAGDLNLANPTDADWLAAANAADATDDRVLQTIIFLNGVRPDWIWMSADDSGAVMAKDFAVIDDRITFRLYEREAAPYNGRIDVMVFTNNGDYRPSDADYRAAVPEPVSLVLAAVGSMLLLRRRRAKSDLIV